MGLYMIQGSYTPQAWAAQIKNPSNRLDAVAQMMAKSGVKFHGAYYAFGEFDIVIIAEGPDNKSVAAALIAAAGGGALSKVQTTVLMSSAEGLEAIKGAGKVAYSPPG